MIFFNRKKEPKLQQENIRYMSQSGRVEYSANIAESMQFFGEKLENSFSSRYNLPTKINYKRARKLTRRTWTESIQARSITGRISDLGVGSGLRLESMPVWDLCNPKLSDAARIDWQNKTEQLFKLSADSTEFDITGRFSFGELQALCMLKLWVDGEYFAIIRYLSDSDRMSNTAIQFIDPSQVRTPTDKQFLKNVKTRGNIITDGIEQNTTGKIIAIHVYDSVKQKTARIPIQKNGRRFVLFDMNVTDPQQLRGVSPLLPVVQELKKLTDYQIAEIEAACLNATIAAWIKPSDTANASKTFTGQIKTDDSKNTDVNNDASTGIFRKFGQIIQNLKKGEELVSYNTQRPNINYEKFETGIMNFVSASVGLPIEVLKMNFSSSYSASRAAIQIAYFAIEKSNKKLYTGFNQPFYESWLSEKIKTGEILASNFTGSPVLRKSWCSAQWLGRSMPSLNPVADATAATKRIDAGLTTREREAQTFNGSDYNENIKKLKIENEKLREANNEPGE